MTIRYECSKCESVLRIRDELAGSKAKCPKCKTAFVVPAEKTVAKKVAAGVGAGSVADEEDPVDMPMEVTPVPDLSQFAESDSHAENAVAVSASADLSPDAPRPSIAELMREHEEKRRRKEEKKKKKSGAADVGTAGDVVTAGTAAEALTRSYDQKREKASEPPPMTREERRELERREALQQFLKKMIPIAAGFVLLLFLFFRWMWAEPLPELGYVTGVVTKGGSPVPAGYEVQFVPIVESPASEKEGRKDRGMKNPSTGYTDAEGRYVLMYNSDVEGAVIGKHRVYVRTSSSVDMYTPGNEPIVEVVEGTNEIDLPLP